MKNEFKTFTEAVTTRIQHIRIKFSIQKCTMLIMRSKNDTKRTELDYQTKKKQECSEKRKPTKKILVADTIKQVEMKEKN